VRRSALALAGIGITGVFVLAAGGGVAIGSAVKTVSSDGKISACVQSANGGIRIVNSTAECNRPELPLTWQQKASTAVLARSSRHEVTQTVYTDQLDYRPQVLAETSFQIAAGERKLIRLSMVLEGAMNPDGTSTGGGECRPPAEWPESGPPVPNYDQGFVIYIDGKRHDSGFGTNAGGVYVNNQQHVLEAGTHTVRVTAAPAYCEDIVASGRQDLVGQVVVVEEAEL
jgi:hypothetical protein